MLDIAGLSAGYGEGQVLRALDLRLAPGESLALLGRNGMGKTTLLKTIMGLLRVGEGRLSFDGQDMRRMTPHRRQRLGLGYVPQGRQLFGALTVEENLRIGFGEGRGSAEEAEGLALAYELFPILAERRGQVAGTLSGGQQQMLAIARAVMGAPRLLLLDEPSEGVQPSIVRDIAGALAGHAARQGMALLLVEQNLDLALSLASRCCFMERGQIVASHESQSLGADRGPAERFLGL